MRKLILALGLLASTAFSQSQTFTYSYSGLPLPIYPDDWNTVTVISLMVPRSLAISRVTASVTAQYSGVGDINLFLFSAAGTRSKLLERNCGGLQNINATFDDSAPTNFRDTCPSAATQGSYRGNEPLSNSVNENAFGLWRIAIENNGSDRTGTISGFSVTITGTPVGPPIIGPNTIVSAATLQGGPVAPGDQVALIGANLGPTEGMRANATTTLPTNLGGTSVTFDGTAAPLYYSSSGLVVVHAPIGLAPGAVSRIQVTSASGSSAAIPTAVAPSKPGILTYDAGGVGQARAFNQNGTLNGDGSVSGSAAAAPGSFISVYATGLGPLSPQVPTGSPAPMSPFSTATLPITANIAGRAATVSWAGAAPGQVGVYQVNILVPVGTPAGAARIVVSADGNPSQHGATVQIR
jgi:uncharacterized protein (TIGR03437 family)